MEFTELLIENVKKHSVLFDLSHLEYKNVRIKNKVWDEMVKDMKLGSVGGDELKKRWRNLRDCYAKYLRFEKTRTGQEAKSICRYRSWPWAQHMEFFRSSLQFAKTESNISNSDTAQTSEPVNEEKESSNAEFNEDAETKESSNSEQEKRSEKIVYTGNNLGKKRKADTTLQSSSVDKIIHFLNEKHSNSGPHLDEIDLVFQGYAASVKKLSPRRQTMIKFKIAQLIMEEEMAQQADIEAASQAGTRFSFHSPNTSVRSSDDTSYLSNTYSPPEVSGSSTSAAT